MPGRSQTRVRLACVKHAASVRSEPGSNSHVQSRQTRHPHNDDRPVVQRPEPPHRDQTQSRATKRSRKIPPRTHTLAGTRPSRTSHARPTALRRRPRIPSFPTMSISNPHRHAPAAPAGSPKDPPSREDAYMAPPGRHRQLVSSPPCPERRYNKILPSRDVDAQSSPRARNSATIRPASRAIRASSVPAVLSGGASAGDR